MVWKKLVPIAVICALSLVAGSAAQGSKGTKHHHKHHHARLPADFFGMNPNSGPPTPAQFARMRARGDPQLQDPRLLAGDELPPRASTAGPRSIT